MIKNRIQGWPSSRIARIARITTRIRVMVNYGSYNPFVTRTSSSTCRSQAIVLDKIILGSVSNIFTGLIIILAELL
jgi:hypothetical protein